MAVLQSWVKEKNCYYNTGYSSLATQPSTEVAEQGKIMAPIVRSLPSYVKDSQHALEMFRDFNFLGEGKLIFTMDITALYTVIPNGEGPLALKHFFWFTHS